MALDNFWYGRDSRLWRADGLSANAVVPSTISVLSTNNTGSISFVAGAEDVEALIAVRSADVLIRIDFVTTPPTTFGTGIPVSSGQNIRLPITPNSPFAVVAIGTSASNATVFVQFLKAV